MGLHLCPIEPADWTDPPEGDDPLEGVEHPRERKSNRRDRHDVRWRMQRAMNEREWATIRDFGNGQKHATSLQARSLRLNHAEFEVRRALITREHDRMCPAARADYLARLRRYVLFARELRLAPKASG
jgi:hypothetical protein